MDRLDTTSMNDASKTVEKLPDNCDEYGSKVLLWTNPKICGEWKSRIGDFKKQIQRQGFTKRRKLPEAIPLQKTNSKPQVWFSRLAGEEPLRDLCTTMPLQYQPNTALLKEFVDKEVPVLRATWFLKITILNKQKRSRAVWFPPRKIQNSSHFRTKNVGVTQ